MRGASPAGPELALVWRITAFDALTPRELQAIYMARQKVFAIEQNCVYLDVDGFDERALHLAAWSPLQREPAAYARLLEPGAKYAEASIGRVLTVGVGRGRGLGRMLMLRALERAAATWPEIAVRIGAQTRLESFYASLGFVAIGPPYLEDGIDHTEMLRPAVADLAPPRPPPI
jgi:ElaA protein